MGLLDDGTEYLRRSGRNLGGLLDYLAGNAASKVDAKNRSVEATKLQMQGADLTPDQLDALHNPPYGGFGTDAGMPGGGIVGTYAGIGAKNVPRRALANAQKAAAKGMDNEAVRQKYGWFQDPTGDWKYEISDHAAELRTDKTGRYVLHHPDLARQYPDLLKTLKIEEMPGTDRLGRENPIIADYNPTTNTARLNLSQNANREEALRSLMHEIQHAVQDAEGHSPGTSQTAPEIGHLVNTEYWPKYERIENDITLSRKFRENVMNLNPGMTLEQFHDRHPDWHDQYMSRLQARNTFPDVSTWTFEKYKAALGETEARDTMNRLRLTPDQRRQNQPYVGEGIPANRLWDVRDVTRQLAKAADQPQTFQGLLNRTLGPSPEVKGMIGSLLGIPFLPDDTE